MQRLGLKWLIDKRTLFFIIVFIIILLVSVLIRISPYIIHDYRFEIGFDTGLYEQLLSAFQNSNNWGVLPAYPTLPDYQSRLTHWVEPGFFVTGAMANTIMGISVGNLFRFYMPSLVGILSVIIGFTVTARISGSASMAFLAGILISISYVQLNAVNESYYRQLFGTILLILSLLYLDRYLRQGQIKNLFLFILLSSGIVAYHLPVFMLVWLLLFCLLAISIIHKNYRLSRGVIFSLASMTLISSPAWLPKTDDLIRMLMDSISGSLWRVSTIPTGEGLWQAGGSIPKILWSYPHILIGYAIISFPVVLLFVFAIQYYRENHRFTNPLLLLSIILVAYIGFWLYFGNRFLLDLDFALCMLAPVGLVFFLNRLDSSKLRKLAVISIGAMFLLPISVTLDYQSSASPYIRQNEQGIAWIRNNIEIDTSVIFAPDYISSDLLQMGYRMAIWDYTLTPENEHPMPAAEHFMIESPVNITYLSEFFQEHPNYRDLEIYVLWGSWDLDRPMVATGKLIPIDQYSASTFYGLEYSGHDEILSVYRYIGPRF